jgi:hypothetical protein
VTDADEKIFHIVVVNGGTGIQMKRESVENRENVRCVTGSQVKNRFAGGGEDGFDHNDPPLWKVKYFFDFFNGFR